MIKSMVLSFLNGCAYQLGMYAMHVATTEVEKKREKKIKETKKKRVIGFNVNAA